ncbi:Mitogen-activated protein kinase kinase kinase [Quillaja saponaria]|uniref:Mitogen-activated protein kinase kinase kinase n=1 Tax=Quillaja saponaria TaxID=32244 RepID=A0AAD7LN34_QUISA|nr:Mitogen-activated protein kinase kinase kinase [Quillaja saponaria]
MEDSVTESESLILPLNLSPKVGLQEGDDHEEQQGDRGGERPTGFFNKILSNIVSKGEGEGDGKEEASEGVKDEGKVGGGLINNLISNEVHHPLSPKAGEVTENGVSKSEEVVGSGVNGGGIINNLICNLFHQSEYEGEENQKRNEGKEVTNGVVENEQGKKEEGESGGGGIIDHIVSHLPTSFPDDAVPTTDEATILIHSIIHD